MSYFNPAEQRASESSNLKLGLTTTGIRWRVLYLALLPAALFAVALVRPDSLLGWLPFATSCGAITGLPCIFCGTTRAVHHLLHGEFRSALYYNWLAYPIVASAFVVFLLNALELLLDRDFIGGLARLRFTRRSLPALAVGFVLLGCLQVYLAVSQHKTEQGLDMHDPSCAPSTTLSWRPCCDWVIVSAASSCAHPRSCRIYRPA